MFKHIQTNLILAVLTLALCSVAYPLVLLNMGNIMFPASSKGSLVIDKNQKVIGSLLIAQEFKGDEWFQPRPSAAGFNGAASSGSNLGASSPRLRDRVAQQLGPVVSYKPGSPSAGLDKTHPKKPQEDIEAWFAAKPDRVVTWAAGPSVAAINWAKTDLVDDKYGLQGQFILQWSKEHPEVIADWKKENPDSTESPKPEDLVPYFFASYARIHPAQFPIVVEVKKPDGTLEKKIAPGVSDGSVHANFFDLCTSDPANKSKVSDLEMILGDAVTTSGSGLDPHITLANTLSQLDRVAAKRSKTPEDFNRTKDGITALIKEKSFAPLWGVAGESMVNVLEINQALEAKYPRQGIESPK